uniref:Uncharacterized protein n=1 Tax=Acrobeloides nanus TaxID=290746 RepID=A0A914CBM9_9BILA
MDVYAVLDWTTTCWFMVFGTNPLNALFGVGWIMSPTIDDVGFLPTNIMTLALAINRFVAISGFSIGISERLFANYYRTF